MTENMPGGLRARLARATLFIFRWKLIGKPPANPGFVLIAAPHTSNFDLLWLLLMAWAHAVPIQWLAKAELFYGPVGWVLTALGGVPVRRSARENRVEASAAAFRDRPQLVLVVPPEGTRSHTQYWKSGFLHIARRGGVPLVPTALDYGTRTGEFGSPVNPDRDTHLVMDDLRAFYAGRTGRRPNAFGPVRLRDEQDP